MKTRLKRDSARPDCSVDGCPNPAERNGDNFRTICAGHRRKKKLNKPMVALQPPRSGRKRLTPWQLLEKAVDEYWECDVRDDVAYRRAKARLSYACHQFSRSRRPSKLSRPPAA